MSAPSPSSSSSSSPAAVVISPDQLHQMYTHIQHLEARIAQMQQPAAAPAPAPPVSSHVRVDVRKPEAFDGKKPGRTPQFIEEVTRYLTLGNLLNHPQVIDYAGQFLTGNAGIWFTNVQKSGNPITTLDDFNARVRARWIPYGLSRTARTTLYALRQKMNQPVNEYSTEFMRILECIEDMAVADQIEHYINGLVPSLRNEVHRCIERLDTLEKTMNQAAFAEQLIGHRYQRYGGTPYNRGQTGSNGQPQPRVPTGASAASSASDPMELSNINGAPQFHEEDEEPAVDSSVLAINGGRLQPLTPELKVKLIKEGRCFRCRETGHVSRDCPKNQVWGNKPKNSAARQ